MPLCRQSLQPYTDTPSAATGSVVGEQLRTSTYVDAKLFFTDKESIGT